ncbi:MAG: ATP-binding cassette domain-containing protein, partial [Gemmatimonadetes bacterium]|nr:ATP-binding cassette domain-containing protein [Gemmatimonadota bacterium]
TRRRKVAALDDVSLAVGESEIVALVGESGSGKSTLGRVVVGLERLDSGEAVFDGVEYSRMSERRIRRLRRNMHLVLQDPYQSLCPSMRVGTAVAEPLEIAEALVVGPGEMPVFAFSPHETDSIVAFIAYLEHRPDRGGADIGGVGPVPEFRLHDTSTPEGCPAAARAAIAVPCPQEPRPGTWRYSPS